MTEETADKQTIKDPYTDIEFDRPLSDEELHQILEVRHQHDKEAESVRMQHMANIEELQNQINYHQDLIQAAEDKVQVFDEQYMPGVRATLLHNRERHNETTKNTPHYSLGCKISNIEKPKYDSDNPQIVEWAKKNAPDVLKGQEVAKAKFNRILKKLKRKEMPAGIEWQTPPVTFPMTRLD